MRRHLCVLFFVLMVASNASAETDVWFVTALTGGGSGALDALDITAASSPNVYDIDDGDVAFYRSISGDEPTFAAYVFDADATDAESSPSIIRPDDYATAGVWRLALFNATGFEGIGPDGSHWLKAANTVDITATATEGRVAYGPISGDATSRHRAADGSDWANFFLLKEDVDTESEFENLLGFSITVPGELGSLNSVTPGTGVATWLATPSSVNLVAALTDETGTGSAVFATSPTLVTPALGTPASGNLANCTFPTLNQNTTGNAANLSGTPALPNGTTATTQSANDNSTKLATTAYVDTNDDTGTDDQTIDVLSLDGTTLQVSLENDGEATKTVDLSGLQDGTGTDDQTASEVTSSATGNIEATNVDAAIAELESEKEPSLKDTDRDIWQSIGISVAALIADETNCSAPDSEQINSGPNMWFSTCGDAAGTLETPAIPMPENWDGGNIYVELIVGSAEASPSGTVEFEVSTMARGNDDLINNTWVTGNNIQFASNIDTQYDVVVAESDVIEASGAGGDLLIIKLTRDNDDGTNDTSTQDVEVWGVRIFYQIDDLDERD